MNLKLWQDYYNLVRDGKIDPPRCPGDAYPLGLVPFRQADGELTARLKCYSCTSTINPGLVMEMKAQEEMDKANV